MDAVIYIYRQGWGGMTQYFSPFCGPSVPSEKVFINIRAFELKIEPWSSLRGGVRLNCLSRPQHFQSACLFSLLLAGLSDAVLNSHKAQSATKLFKILASARIHHSPLRCLWNSPLDIFSSVNPPPSSHLSACLRAGVAVWGDLDSVEWASVGWLELKLHI